VAVDIKEGTADDVELPVDVVVEAKEGMADDVELSVA